MNKIFISFDYDKDRRYKYLLVALKENSKNDIEFIDNTPGEIQSSDISQIKRVLSSKIRDATHTLIIVGQYANQVHTDSKMIGTVNWQWWEIEKSIELNKKLIAVKINGTYNSPKPLLAAKVRVSWAMSYTLDSIRQAINNS